MGASLSYRATRVSFQEPGIAEDYYAFRYPAVAGCGPSQVVFGKWACPTKTDDAVRPRVLRRKCTARFPGRLLYIIKRPGPLDRLTDLPAGAIHFHEKGRHRNYELLGPTDYSLEPPGEPGSLAGCIIAAIGTRRSRVFYSISGNYKFSGAQEPRAKQEK